MTLMAMMMALAVLSVGMWAGMAVRHRMTGQSAQWPRMAMLGAALLFATTAAAQTSGPVNSLPKVNIPQDNGAPNAKGLSTDPQIANCVADSTGVTATTTSFTVFKDAAHMTCTTRVGALVSSSTDGTVAITRSGLYRARIGCNGTGTNGNTMTNVASISTDGGATWADIGGASAIAIALTADLTKNMNAQGYVAVTSGQAAAGTTLIAARGKNSANTTTCASGEILSVERVNTSMPYAYP